MKGVNVEDSYQINLIVGFLLHFPEIFTINYDLASSSYCFTFMIRDKMLASCYKNLCKDMEVIWGSYCYFSKLEPSRINIRKKYFSGLTRLDIYIAKDTLNSGEVNLVNSVIQERFKDNLISDYRVENFSLFKDYSQAGDDYLEYLLIQGEQNVKTLFAFRESGKVYVLNR